ncbi:MAG: protein kinase, partial [Acidobacteria bacterium]|nr:protein kinase [Acidobacteriota bacterium]
IEVAGLPPDVRERFNRETAICKELDHPNLVKVYDSGEAEGVLYQAMDLLEGADLSKVLAERRPLSWEQKLSIMEQVCDGLAYAHARQLVHRDIKPANIFLENSGRIRILDFGMARVESSMLTKVGMAVGTLTYMAPEQIRGETCTAASDVFAAGIVFYELASGKHPFSLSGTELPEILRAVLFQATPPLKQLAPDAPDGLELVLTKALEKNRDHRLQNAGDFKQALSLCKITLKLRAPASPSAEPFDPAKTVVVRRPDRPAAPPAPPPPPSKAEPAPPPPKPVPKPQLIFCPSCTHGNPRDAVTCARCGLPLIAEQAPMAEAEASDKSLQWAVIVVAAVGILLLLYLIFR